jgi:tetratricopeptide (TPR) repeat protein
LVENSIMNLYHAIMKTLSKRHKPNGRDGGLAVRRFKDWHDLLRHRDSSGRLALPLLLTLSILLLLAIAPALQAAPTAEMELQPRVLRVGEPAELKFTIRGINNPPRPPIQPISGLQINGPSVGSSINQSIVNGRITTDRATIFTYRVIPLQTGQFKVGPYTYVFNNNSIRIDAIDLQVISSRASDGAANAQGLNQGRALFARLTTDKKALYNQEIFDLYVEIFHRGDINIGRDISLINMPTDGLSLQAFEELATTREVVDNEIYQVRRFRTKAHALTAGNFTLAPTLRVPLLVPRQRRQSSFFDDPFAGFFGSHSTQPVDITPDPLTLNIKALPTQDRPEGFSGAVGEFTFAVEVRPEELEAGEPITVSMIINGAGNIENVSAPAFPESSQFKQYETRRVENDISQQNAIGRKVFEQVIIPRSADVTQVPALSFSYFNPIRQQYETITKGPFPITVHKSSRDSVQMLQSNIRGTEEQAKLLGADLVYLKPSPPEWKPYTPPNLLGSKLFLGSLLVPPLLFGILLLVQRRRNELQQNQAKARRMRAPKSAREGLRNAQKALQSGQTDAFYEALWQALSTYFGHRMNLAPGEVTPARVLEFARHGGMDETLLAELSSVFEACDAHRFGAGLGASDQSQTQQHYLKTIPTILKQAERIKSIALALLIATITTLTANAQLPSAPTVINRHAGPAEMFAAASQAYDQGDVKRAASLYESILDDGYQYKAVYFNLGNALFRLGEPGEAVLNFKKALLLDPHDSDVRANLRFVEEHAGALVPPENLAVRTLNTMTLRGWLITAAMLWILLFAILIIGLMLPRTQTATRRIAAALWVLLLIALAGVHQRHQLRTHPEGVAVLSSQQVLSAPLAGSTVLFELPEASVVRIKQENGQWYYIKAGKQSGWIPRPAIQPVTL